MKTLGEIIRAVKTGGETTHEECLYAVAAMHSLSTFDSMDFRKILKNKKFITPEIVFIESSGRWRNALEKDPKEWLGIEHDPMNESNQQRVIRAQQVVEKLREKTKNKTGG